MKVTLRYPPSVTSEVSPENLPAVKKATAVGANPTEAVSHLVAALPTACTPTHFMRCTENSPEEAELGALTDVTEASER